MKPSVVEFDDRNVTVTKADDFHVIVDDFQTKQAACARSTGACSYYFYSNLLKALCVMADSVPRVLMTCGSSRFIVPWHGALQGDWPLP